MIFQTSSSCWITEDCGDSFRSFECFDSFVFHPIERNLVLGLNVPPYCHNCFHYEPNSLHESVDLGRTWSLLINETEDYFWAPFRTRSHSIVITRFSGKEGSLEILFSNDVFQSLTIVVPNGCSTTRNRFFFFAFCTGEQGRLLKIGSFKFDEIKSALLPWNDIKDCPGVSEFSSEIVYSEENRVFLTGCSEENRRDLYVSDETGTRFVRVLKSALETNDDFANIEEGVFLINAYLPAKSLQRVALISYDKGSSWHPLRPPISDSGLSFCSNQDDCSLHLFCGSVCLSNICHTFNPKSDQGLIIGLGNVGTQLLEDPNNANAYVSRDGGYSWRKIEVLKGSYSFEIALEGSIIIAVPNRIANSEIYYSWNQGVSWQSQHFTKLPFYLSNLILDPQSTKHMIITGETRDYNQYGGYQRGKTILIGIDLTTLGNIRSCESPPKPDNPGSNFEIWSPLGIGPVSCVLGQQKRFIRRKEGVLCLDFNRIKAQLSPVTCECTDYDWECDFGYERQKDGFDCIPIFPDLAGTSGYRKIPGSKCLGGVSHPPSPSQNYTINTKDHVITDKPDIIENTTIEENKQSVQMSWVSNVICGAIIGSVINIIICLITDPKCFFVEMLIWLFLNELFFPIALLLPLSFAFLEELFWLSWISWALSVCFYAHALLISIISPAKKLPFKKYIWLYILFLGTSLFLRAVFVREIYWFLWIPTTVSVTLCMSSIWSRQDVSLTILVNPAILVNLAILLIAHVCLLEYPVVFVFIYISRSFWNFLFFALPFTVHGKIPFQELKKSLQRDFHDIDDDDQEEIQDFVLTQPLLDDEHNQEEKK